MSGRTRKTAPSAETPRAEESLQADYRADCSAEAVIDAMDYAQLQLRCAGVLLVHGNLPACVGAFEASRKAICAAHDSLAGLMARV